MSRSGQPPDLKKYMDKKLQSMGGIQGGVRNLFGHLEKTVNDWINEDFKKSYISGCSLALAKMHVGKDAGMGRIQGGVRNLFGRLDKSVENWMDGFFKNTSGCSSEVELMHVQFCQRLLASLAPVPRRVVFHRMSDLDLDSDSDSDSNSDSDYD